MQNRREADLPARLVAFFSGRYCAWVILALILIFTAGVRFRLRDTPLERDEGEYAYAGQVILQGIPPYKLAYNMKFPGIYVSYAAMMGVFGETAAGVHLGFMCINALAIALVYLLTARLAGRGGALVAAGLYAYGTLDKEFLGISAHATHFVVAAALGGVLLLLRGIERDSRVTLFGSGVLLGVAVLQKQHGILFAAFAGGYLIRCKASRREWKKLVEGAVALSIGFLLPLILTGLWLWKTGVWDAFWFWTIQYARTYAEQFQGLKEVWHNLDQYTPNLIWVTLGFAVPALMLLWRKASRDTAVFATGFFGASVLAICPGFYFRPHYFVLLLPATAMLTGVVAGEMARYFRQRQSNRGVALTYAAFAGLLLLGVGSQRKLFFQFTPEQASDALYGRNYPFVESQPIAEYVKAHTTPDTRIAVIGSEPQIYFYARRHSATGYIYTYALMEAQPFALRMQRELIGEVEGARPEYLIWVDMESSWTRRHDSERLIFFWLRKFLIANYDAVGAVDMSGKKAVYYWDEQAPVHEATAEILVYRRRTAITK